MNIKELLNVKNFLKQILLKIHLQVKEVIHHLGKEYKTKKIGLICLRENIDKRLNSIPPEIKLVNIISIIYLQNNVNSIFF